MYLVSEVIIRNLRNLSMLSLFILVLFETAGTGLASEASDNAELCNDLFSQGKDFMNKRDFRSAEHWLATVICEANCTRYAPSTIAEARRLYVVVTSRLGNTPRIMQFPGCNLP